MTDLSVRLAVVAVVVLVALAWAALRRRGAAWRRRAVEMPGLGSGVYLFTSETCSSCPAARDSLTVALGSHGFEEITYEEQPELFDRLSITRVPTVAQVRSDGRAWAAQGVLTPRRARRWVLERGSAGS